MLLFIVVKYNCQYNHIVTEAFTFVNVCKHFCKGFIDRSQCDLCDCTLYIYIHFDYSAHGVCFIFLPYNLLILCYKTIMSVKASD